MLVANDIKAILVLSYTRFKMSSRPWDENVSKRHASCIPSMRVGRARRAVHVWAGIAAAQAALGWMENILKMKLFEDMPSQ